jgi:DNA-binding CsgD family transcriptional regulator
MKEAICNATISDFKRGYIWSNNDEQFICLICGHKIGSLNTDLDLHVSSHGNQIERLLLLEKKYTGLTEIQKELLTMMVNKNTNKEISMNLNCTESTIRNMKFALRERSKQARAFLAITELIEEDRITKMQPKLRSLPAKEEKRKALLPRFISLFEPNKEYSEEAVKKLIRPIYSDDAMIRRYLNRSSDGSKYYRNSEEKL